MPDPGVTKLATSGFHAPSSSRAIVSKLGSTPGGIALASTSSSSFTGAAKVVPSGLERPGRADDAGRRGRRRGRERDVHRRGQRAGGNGHRGVPVGRLQRPAFGPDHLRGGGRRRSRGALAPDGACVERQQRYDRAPRGGADEPRHTRALFPGWDALHAAASIVRSRNSLSRPEIANCAGTAWPEGPTSGPTPTSPGPHGGRRRHLFLWRSAR